MTRVTIDESGNYEIDQAKARTKTVPVENRDRDTINLEMPNVQNDQSKDPKEVQQVREDAVGDGGPAFPTSGAYCNHGMTLRDWFAGQALAGMCAAQSSRSWEKDLEQCYIAADTALKARVAQ